MARKLFKFWLDDTKTQENQLIEQVDILKQDRSFTQTIRDGIRLIQDLRQGSLDVLFELFPFVQAEFLKYMKDVKSDNGDNGDDIKQQIARLEQLILAQQNNPDTPVMKPQNGGLRPLGNSGGLKGIGANTAIKPPVFDDEDIELNVSKAKGDGSATQNFLASMMALQQ